MSWFATGLAVGTWLVALLEPRGDATIVYGALGFGFLGAGLLGVGDE